MKLSEITLTPPIVAISVALLTALAAVDASATDRYVSADGKYGEGLGECYTDLQTAVTAAQNDETVWVTNGFVCASGIGGDAKNKSRIDVPNRRITIRSQAGLVDEAKGLGATIKGPGTSCADADQARCVYFNGTTAQLIGFVLEDGYPNENGGAVAGSASLLKNCVVRNSKGKRGGGVSGALCEDCVITNNYATEMGGGVYYSTKLTGCSIAYNRTGGYGGGVGTWSPVANTFYTNCWFFGNYSKSQGGGLAFRGGPGPVVIVDCVMSNNTIETNQKGGGCFSEQYAAKLFDCDIVENVVTNASGGGLAGCVATDCRILRNIGISNGSTYSSGAGAYDSVLTNCVVSFNTNDCLVTGKMYACGGGAYTVTAVNCRFEGNYTNYRGGAMYGACTTYNCTVVGNAAPSGGAGAWSGAHYNGLFVGNAGNGLMDYEANGNTSSCAVNCTFVGNTSSGGLGFYQIGTAINCVSWGNGRKSGGVSSPYDYAYKAVSNCCCAVMPQVRAGGDVYGCFVADPKFRTIGGKGYYVGNKDCKNASLPFDWMTDANDARSKDVYGNARVIGTAADLGAVESKIFGLSVLVR